MPDTLDGLRAQALAFALKIFASQSRRPAFPFEICLRDGTGGKAEFTFPRPEATPILAAADVNADADRHASTPTDGATPNLQRVHRRILESANDRPATSKELIRKAGYPISSYSRGAITLLLQHGFLRRISGEGLVRCQELPAE